jgi:hypothetical protein
MSGSPVINVDGNNHRYSNAATRHRAVGHVAQTV